MKSNAPWAAPRINAETTGLETQTAWKRLFRLELFAKAGVVLFGAVLALSPLPAPAQSPAHTTVVVFSDRPMPDQAWTALFDAVRKTAESSGDAGAFGQAGTLEDGKAIDFDASAEFVRGDAVKPGMQVNDAISVYLHGDCALQPLPRRTAYGVPLGWVLRQDGRIAPFIHVDCTRIGQVLGAEAQGLDSEARERMMAEAMARVLVHEWIHVAAQTDRHGRNGITKASFDVADLIGESKPRTGESKPRTSGR